MKRSSRLDECSFNNARKLNHVSINAPCDRIVRPSNDAQIVAATPPPALLLGNWVHRRYDAPNSSVT